MISGRIKTYTKWAGQNELLELSACQVLHSLYMPQSLADAHCWSAAQ